MSRVRRYHEIAGTTWDIRQNDDGTFSMEQAQLLVLQDIRAELKKISDTLRCTETQRIPRYLRRIANNTAKPRAKKKP